RVKIVRLFILDFSFKMSFTGMWIMNCMPPSEFQSVVSRRLRPEIADEQIHAIAAWQRGKHDQGCQPDYRQSWEQNSLIKTAARFAAASLVHRRCFSRP